MELSIFRALGTGFKKLRIRSFEKIYVDRIRKYDLLNYFHIFTFDKRKGENPSQFRL